MSEEKSHDRALREIDSLIPVIVAAARTGDYAGTSRLCNVFLQKLEAELSKGHVMADHLSKITYSLETLLAMQKMENWVAFADVLEYEFLPLLQHIAPDMPVS
jgi:hypothetical protein